MSRASYTGLIALLLTTCGRNTAPAAEVMAPSSAHSQQPAISAARTAAHSSADRAPDEAPGLDAAIDTASLPALHSDSALVALPVPGFRDAMVSVPLGATRAKPVVLALHGNFDRPEWQCEVWRSIVRDSAFVLCPRGVPRKDAPRSADRWEYAGFAKTRDEIDAALSALRQRFGAHVADEPLVYTGFSLGAILGVRLVQRDPARYPRVVLIEGGQSGWTRATARAFKRAGGERLLFACGQPGCSVSSRPLVRSFDAAGVSARVVSGGNVGHTYDGSVADAIRENWSWLVEEDPRFQ